MSAQHTPGPWSVGRSGHVRAPGTQSPICLPCFGGDFQDRRAEADANARLIAAAPDLLEACNRIKAEKAPSYHDCIDNGEPECAWCAVFNAIAKATADA